MAISAKLQAARKQNQKARLKKKGDDDYPEFYANQPLQQVKAAENEKIRKAREDVKNAVEDLALAEETGEGLKEAQEGLPVARMVLYNLQEAKRAKKHPGVRLTASAGDTS